MLTSHLSLRVGLVLKLNVFRLYNLKDVWGCFGLARFNEVLVVLTKRVE